MAKITTKPDPKKKSYTFVRVGENLYRIKETGGYYALIKRNRKQIRRSLKTTDKSMAKRRLQALLKKVENLRIDAKISNITFLEYSQRWLEKTGVNVKEKTSQRLKHCLDGLTPYIGYIPVRNISPRNCEEWIIGRGKMLSASSYKQERRVLISILEEAVRDGLILENPARDLPTRKISKSTINLPTHEQFRLLIKQMRQADIRGIYGADLVELLAYSGMRLNEATELRWPDIDFDRGCFTITGGEYGTKNHEVRTVPLFPAMLELLNRIQSEPRKISTDRVIPIKGARSLMASASKKAKIPRFTHHSMRHYFCSNAIEAGIDFKVIAGWLGHKDGGILVAKTYGHLRDTHSFEMAKRMTNSAFETPSENIVSITNKTA